MSTSTSRVLIALVAGLLAGAATAAIDIRPLHTVAAIIAPIGTLWVRALQMVLIPLVLALLITGIVNTADSGATGRLGLTALGVFLALLVGTAVVSAVVATPLVARIPIETQTIARMQSTIDTSVVATARQLPRFSERIPSALPSTARCCRW